MSGSFCNWLFHHPLNFAINVELLTEFYVLNFIVYLLLVFERIIFIFWELYFVQFCFILYHFIYHIILCLLLNYVFYFSSSAQFMCCCR